MRIAVLGCALLVAGAVSAQVTMYGVLTTEGHAIGIDSVNVQSDTSRFMVRTPGWGGQPGMTDTFAFPQMSAWPTVMKTYSAWLDSTLITNIVSPMPDSWYIIEGPFRPPQPKVMFYRLSSVEEPGQAEARSLQVRVAPTVGGSGFVFRAPLKHVDCAQIAIRGASGRVVRTISLGASGTAIWSGDDDQCRQLPDGVYYCSLAGEAGVPFTKTVLAR